MDKTNIVERINFDFKALRELPIVVLLQTLWHKVMTVRFQRYHINKQLLITRNIHYTAYQSSTHTELRLTNIKFKSQILLEIALQKIPPYGTCYHQVNLHVLAININRMIYHVHMPLLLYYVLTIYSLLSFYHNFVQFKPGKIPTLQIFILLYSVRMYHHQNLIPIQRKYLHAMPLALAYLGDDLRRSAIDVVKLASMPQEFKIYMRSAWSQLTHMSDSS